MLSPAGPEYALSDDLQPLLEFARTAVTHDHQSRVRAVAPSATGEWCDPKRALVQVHTPDDTAALQSMDGWQVTGMARFQDYGLQFFLADEPAFWYGPDSVLTSGEMICHALTLDCGSRRVDNSILLIEKLDLDRERLAQTARWYDCAAEISALYRPLDGTFDTPADAPLPLSSEAEYLRRKELYGV